MTSVWILLSDSSNKADLGINVSSGLNIGFTHISLTSLIPLLYIFFLFIGGTESFLIVGLVSFTGFSIIIGFEIISDELGSFIMNETPWLKLEYIKYSIVTVNK